jgi:putative nucleotidyltransferase with HDIG domain
MAAPAALVAFLLLRMPSHVEPDPLLALILVVMAAGAANFPVMVTRSYKADATPALELAIVVLLPPAAAVALVGLSRMAGDAILCLRRNPATGNRRRMPIDLIFNTGQLMVAAAAGAVIFQGIVASTRAADGAGEFAAAIIAAASMYVVNTTLVVVAVALNTHRTPFQVWTEAAGVDLKQTAALYAAGYLLAITSVGHPWLALVMVAPLAGLHISLKRAVQMRDQTLAAVESMADVVDRRDPYTFKHSQSVAEHSVRIARQMRLPERDVELIRLAARVHDLGKIAVPDEVLHKQGRLTEAEFALMKKHPETGAEILSKFPEYRQGRELVLAHHERIDGLGYPRGLKGDQIPLGARIMSVADAWDAMTSDRPYRTALEPSVALGELMRGRGTQWDASAVDAFAATLPGAVPESQPEGIAAPVLRSLGAVAGILTS